MNEVLAQIEELVKLVASAPVQTPVQTPAAPVSTGRAPDAIDRILAQPVRTTNVQSLLNSPLVREFEQKIIDGTIRQDAVLQTLAIVRQLLAAALLPVP